MTVKMKILLVLSVMLNLFVLFYGVMSWADTYNPGRQMVVGAILASGLLNMFLIGYEFRSTERRLERQVRIARYRKELKDLDVENGTETK